MESRWESKTHGAWKENCPGVPSCLSAWVSHLTQVGCDTPPIPPWSQLWYGHCRFGKACGPGGDPINGARDSWSPTPFFPLKSKEEAQSAPTCPGGPRRYSGSTRSWKVWFRVAWPLRARGLPLEMRKLANKVRAFCRGGRWQQRLGSALDVEVTAYCGLPPGAAQPLLPTPVFPVLSDLWKGLQTKARLL